MRAKQSNPFSEIAELVPSISEESRSEFASAMPRNRYAPRNDMQGGKAKLYFNRHFEVDNRLLRLLSQ